MKNVVTIVIPTYNNIDGLKYQLNYFKGENYDVVVVDNRPNEDKLKLAKASRSWSKLAKTGMLI